jgi:integrase
MMTLPTELTRAFLAQKEILGGEFRGTIHNLRPTFAVGILRSLLKRGMPTDKAIAIVSDLLGHEYIATTLLYLTIAQDAPTGDEVWEDALDFSGVFDGLGDMEEDLARKEEE